MSHSDPLQASLKTQHEQRSSDSDTLSQSTDGLSTVGLSTVVKPYLVGPAGWSRRTTQKISPWRTQTSLG